MEEYQNNTVCEDANDIALDDPDAFHEAFRYWCFCLAVYGLGAWLGSMTIAGPINNKYGRRKSLLFNAIFTFIIAFITMGMRLIGWPDLMLISRILLGFSNGWAFSVSPIYLIEMAPPSLRGVFGSSFQLMIASGSLIAEVVALPWVLGTNDGWPVLLGLQCIYSVMQLCMYPWTVETVQWSLSVGKDDDANADSFKLYGQYNYDSFGKPSGRKSIGLKQSVAEIFKHRAMRKCLAVGVLLTTTLQFCGINGIMFYSTSIFKTAGLNETLSAVGSLLIGVSLIIGTIITSSLIERLGRRKLLISGLIMMAVGMACMGIFLEIVDNSQVYPYLLMVFLFVGVLGFGVGPGPITQLMMPEMVDIEYRAGCQLFTVAAMQIGFFAVSLGFPLLNDAIGNYVFQIFAGYCFLVAVLLGFVMPETAGKTPSEVQQFFR